MKKKLSNVSLHFAQEKGIGELFFYVESHNSEFLVFNVICITGKHCVNSKLDANLHIKLELTYLRRGKHRLTEQRKLACIK